MHLSHLVGTPETPFCPEPPSLGIFGVQWTNPLEHRDWDRQVAAQNHPARSFFHSSAWANVLADTYGYKPVYFVSTESGKLRSLLPLMEVKSTLTGKRAIALPFTDSCHPLCANPMDFKELFRNAIQLARLRGWKYLEFRGGDALFSGTHPSSFFYGHTLDVPSNENKYFGELPASVRRAIRKAEKSGVRVEISRDVQAVKMFYRLHCKSRRRHGLPPQPFSFFTNIQKHILANDLGAVVAARWKRTPVAASIFFHGDGPAVYKFGASDQEWQHLRGNNLVFWEAIRWASRRGATKLDLGRTSPDNEGLRRFKLGWNALEEKISYFRYCARRNTVVPARDEAAGWHNTIFKGLPLFASRMIGAVLYRHWA